LAHPANRPPSAQRDRFCQLPVRRQPSRRYFPPGLPEEANAIELLRAIVRRHRKYAADNLMHSAAALVVASAAWRLIGKKKGKASAQLPAADQVEVPESDLLEAERRKVEATRLLRYAPVLVKLKRAYGNTCQVDASHRMTLPDSAPYSEVHHLKPVAEGGALADKTFSNCVVVCPSCHILLQYGAVWIDPKDGRTLRHFQRDRQFEGKKLRLVNGHALSKQVLKEVEGRPADSPREAAQPSAAADCLQRTLLRRSRFRQRLSASVDMICIATACAKRTCKTRLLAQALSKPSDFLICAECKS
jgi:hypothetical protein